METALLFLGRVFGWLWERWKPLAVSVTATHHDLYETSSITLAIAPGNIEWGSADRDRFYEMQRTGEVSLVVPTAIVATLSNGESNTARPIYLREVVLRILDYLPEKGALSDKVGIVMRAIQAGGRGADARFDVVFDSTHGSTYRLLRAARSDGYGGPLRMRVDPGRFAEVLICAWPKQTGRYRIRIELELTDGRRIWIKVAKPDISVFHLSNAAAEGLSVTETYEFQTSKSISGAAFVQANQEKLAIAPAPPALPEGRHLSVTANMEKEAS